MPAGGAVGTANSITASASNGAAQAMRCEGQQSPSGAFEGQKHHSKFFGASNLLEKILWTWETTILQHIKTIKYLAPGSEKLISQN